VIKISLRDVSNNTDAKVEKLLRSRTTRVVVPQRESKGIGNSTFHPVDFAARFDFEVFAATDK